MTISKSVVVNLISIFLSDFPDCFRQYLVSRLKWEKLGLVNGKIFVNSYFPPFPSRAFESVRKAWRCTMNGTTVPEIATIAITNKCPYDCEYCSVPDKTVCDLPTGSLIQTIHSLQKMGTYHFSLTGGEPLLREDLIDIVNSVDSRSIVKLFSTGYSLTKKRAKALKEAGLFSINISLDNIDPQKHDAGCNYDGAFDIALNAIQYSKAASLLTCVATVVTKERIRSGEIFRFLEFMRELDVDEVTIFEPIPTGKLAFCDNAILGDNERGLLKLLHKDANGSQDNKYPRIFSFPYVESSEYMGCGAGCTRLHITALGEVMPCDFTQVTFGNIQKEQIKTIWKRMNKTFEKPSSGCFALDNYKLLRESNHKASDIMDSHHIYMNEEVVKKNELPAFYDNLMNNEELIVSSVVENTAKNTNPTDGADKFAASAR